MHYLFRNVWNYRTTREIPQELFNNFIMTGMKLHNIDSAQFMAITDHNDVKIIRGIIKSTTPYHYHQIKHMLQEYGIVGWVQTIRTYNQNYFEEYNKTEKTADWTIACQKPKPITTSYESELSCMKLRVDYIRHKIKMIESIEQKPFNEIPLSRVQIVSQYL